MEKRIIPFSPPDISELEIAEVWPRKLWRAMKTASFA